MAGISDFFLTPQNIERGINLLQSNQGIVNTLTGLPIGPASGRAYIRNLSGSQEPITEDFFSTDQLNEIKRRTAESMANKSMIYEPDAFEKYRGDAIRASQNVIPYNMESPLSFKGTFTDPKVDIDMTLGRAVHKTNPDGTISVIDKHDFGSWEGGRKAGFYSPEGSAYFYGQPKIREHILPPSEEREIMTFPGEKVPVEEMYKTPGTDMGITFKKLPGTEWTTYPPEYETQKYRVSEQPKDVIKRSIDAYNEGAISKSKLARIVGGYYGQRDKLLWDDDDEEGQWDTGFRGQHLKRSAVPVNINLGIISHLNKLRANPNFARYIGGHKDIPTKIRQEAQKIVPKRVAPIHAPSQYREPTPSGNGGGSQRTFSRTSPGGISQATSRAARSGMSGWRLSQGGFI